MNSLISVIAKRIKRVKLDITSDKKFMGIDRAFDGATLSKLIYNADGRRQQWGWLETVSSEGDSVEILRASIATAEDHPRETMTKAITHY